MALFPYNSSQWFNTDLIEHISDYGNDIDVTLRSGKVCRVCYSDRDAFFEAIKDVMHKPDQQRGE